MTINRRFCCPACGFTVFNRRLSTCESCAAPLPTGFLFTPSQIATIEAEHERLEKQRKDLATEAAEIEKKRAKRRETD